MNEFLEKYQKEEVVEYPNQVKTKPLVSVCVVTYNHVNYIKDCLDGILIQKTDFDFEILLGEDESTDGTREISLAYAEKHPDRIRLFLHSRENVIKINGRPTGRFNMLYNFSKTHGKYIALCEGDDYWTDPHKLQKQVDFLEGNPNYGMVHTDVDELYEGTKRILRSVNKKNKKRLPAGKIYDLLLIDNLIRTPTVLLRTELAFEFLATFINKNNKWSMGDYPLWLYIAHKYKIGYIEDSTTVRRFLSESLSQSKSIIKKKFFSDAVFEIKYDFITIYGCEERTKRVIEIKKYKNNIKYNYYLNNKKKVYKYFYKIFKNKKVSYKDLLFFLLSVFGIKLKRYVNEE